MYKHMYVLMRCPASPTVTMFATLAPRRDMILYNHRNIIMHYNV